MIVVGVHFKGARLFAVIDVGFVITDLNDFGRCSTYTMTYGIFNVYSEVALS